MTEPTTIKIDFSIDPTYGADGKREVTVHMAVENLTESVGGINRLMEVLEKTLVTTAKVVISSHKACEHEQRARRIVEFFSH